jgi:adenylate cyclase
MNILIVDDDESIRDLCSEVLRQAGHHASTASSGEEAAQRLHDSWDIVLTDLVLPGGMDGNELIHRVRAQGNADVVVITGHPDLHSAIHAIQAGAFDYLVKPFMPETLLTTIKRCAETRQLSQELAREKALRLELNHAYARLANMEQVREAFGQFVTPEVAEYVLADRQDFLRRGERKNITILFADVRSFTIFTAEVPPEEALVGLNQVFGAVIAAVHHEGGVLNKFIGDGIMALFGAPVPAADHAGAAARAALRAQVTTEALARSRSAAGQHPLRIGIGLNSGDVVAGCVGTKERAEYSVFGYPVNLAARLEEMADGGQILMGPQTTELLAGRVNAQELGTLTLAGIRQPTAVWELLDGGGNPPL